ncbi:MAG TPA: ChbG/HpnK family deacetylase [Sulfurovum sp.]|nr:ChbG/HpnK family deacetylase [Sulfurovum sp.]
MDKVIINADDLGMTPGTNEAIFKGYDTGMITHTSIMANGDYFDEAIEGLHDRKGLGAGMHLVLTYGKALKPNRIYNNSNSFFNLGYLKLILLSINNKVFLKAVEEEFEEQILRVIHQGIALTHIDSHRHIHLIPGIYRIVIKLAKKYNVKRVRLIHENIFDSFSLTRKFNFILNGGIVKYFLLRSFTAINARYENLYHDMKFYSILYTGVVTKDIVQKLKKSNESYEIMIHPSIIALDENVVFYDEDEKSYRISKDREYELDTVLTVEEK